MDHVRACGNSDQYELALLIRHHAEPEAFDSDVDPDEGLLLVAGDRAVELASGSRHRVQRAPQKRAEQDGEPHSSGSSGKHGSSPFRNGSVVSTPDCGATSRPATERGSI